MQVNSVVLWIGWTTWDERTPLLAGAMSVQSLAGRQWNASALFREAFGVCACMHRQLKTRGQTVLSFRKKRTLDCPTFSVAQ